MKERKLHRLMELESNQGVGLWELPVSPGSHCPMHTALSILGQVRGLSSLVVGMPECGFYSRYVTDELPSLEHELHYTYILDSHEVVFGCREGLTKALCEMERDGARYLLMIMTCIPALIGEDLMELAEAFSKSNQAKVVCIDLAHFKRNGYQAGYLEGYACLASLMDRRPKKKSLVNLLGAAGKAEGEDLKSWLKNGGFSLFETAGGYTLGKLQEAAGASLTIVTDTVYLPLAHRLKEQFDIPLVFLSEAYHSREIRDKYTEIKCILGLEDVFAPHTLEELSLTEQLVLQKYVNTPFVSNAALLEVLALSAYLCSLGFTPIALHLEEYRGFMRRWKEDILAHGSNPVVMYCCGQNRTGSLISREDPGPGRLLSLGRMHFNGDVALLEDEVLQQAGQLLGSQRSLHLLKHIITCLEG